MPLKTNLNKIREISAATTIEEITAKSVGLGKTFLSLVGKMKLF